MKRFTDERDAGTRDEVWFVEHPPIYTLGLNADRSHVLAPGEIPLLQIDRGGQVTFHGPGQIVDYLMFDLRRMDIGVRDLVSGIEEAVVAVLADYSIEGAPRPDAPGVYVNGAKVAALGLRVRRGCSYHGLALNVNMDLEPFSRINPCGLLGMEVTQISDLGGPTQIGVVQNLLLDKLSDVYGISLSRLDR